MDWKFWISLAVNLIILLTIFIGRNWLKVSIEKSVQYGFDVKLETLRAELRKNEEQFKRELQTKDAEISSLRDTVIGARASRQALIDKRRIEAIESLWSTFVGFFPYHVVSQSMSHINFEVASKRSPSETGVRQFFDMIGLPVAGLKEPAQFSKTELLFVPPLVWAYFSAYERTVKFPATVAKILAGGFESPSKLLNFDAVNNTLKAVLPHHSDYIDKYGFSCHHYLLEELEEKLVAALRQMLDGTDFDKDSIERSLKIYKEVKKSLEGEEDLRDDSNSRVAADLGLTKEATIAQP